MTTEELHSILDDETRQITKTELCQIIYELRQDMIEKSNEIDEVEKRGEYRFYTGSANAFQVCLDLLNHLGYHDMDNEKDALIDSLKEKIIELRVQRINLSVPDGNCPYAYYSISSSDRVDCGDITCTKCKYQFLKRMEGIIREEVMAESYLKEGN